MIPIFTDRLIIREQSEADAPFILQLMNTEGWLTNIGDRNVHTVEDAAAYIRNGALKSYAEHGFGFFLVALKDTGTPIGICGLAKRPALEHADIGFAFMPQYNGRGYAYESAACIMELAKNTFGLTTICAITLPQNTPSIKLLTRLGLTEKGTFIFPGDDEELLLFVGEVK